MYLDIIFCIKTFYRVAHLPATNPDDQAHCRLKPPHSPFISITSPAKNSPLKLNSIVLGSISLVSTPPAVTCALGQLLCHVSKPPNGEYVDYFLLFFGGGFIQVLCF